MEDRILPAAGQLFIDKEKNLVQFIAKAIYRIMEGEIAVYQALSGDYRVYAMPYADFIKEMQPFSPQQARGFQEEGRLLPDEEGNPAKRLGQPGIGSAESSPEQPSNMAEGRPGQPRSNMAENSQGQPSTGRTDESETIDPVLLAFLDADTYEEKLNILTGSRKNLTDRILNHMAISIDCMISDGDMEDKISSLIYCLKTHARFENKRLR